MCVRNLLWFPRSLAHHIWKCEVGSFLCNRQILEKREYSEGGEEIWSMEAKSKE